MLRDLCRSRICLPSHLTSLRSHETTDHGRSQYVNTKLAQLRFFFRGSPPLSSTFSSFTLRIHTTNTLVGKQTLTIVQINELSVSCERYTTSYLQSTKRRSGHVILATSSRRGAVSGRHSIFSGLVCDVKERNSGVFILSLGGGEGFE